MSDLKDPRILTIQSHVVSGYAGNKVASFILQLLGFETDILNSVQFSNHTRYKHFKGQILSCDELNELFEGVKLNNLDRNYTHLLTGYTKSLSFARELLSIVQHSKSINPNLLYLCDPVLGDNGKCYVPNEIIEFYKTKLISEALIITPNQYEAEWLTDMKICSEEDAINCLNALHARGPQIVVIKSSNIDEKNNVLIGFISRRLSDTKYERYRIRIPKFDAYFVGTGDLFSSVFIVWLTKTHFDIKCTLEKTIATLQSVLKDTIYHAEQKEDGLSSIANIELRIIQNKNHIENPTVEIFACQID